MTDPHPLEPTGRSWVLLCAADALDSGAHMAVVVGDKQLCVVNHGGTFYAVDDQCTHGPARLSDGYVDTEEAVVECPLHGGQFRYCDGAALGAPAVRPLCAYPTRIEDGRVMVAL